MAGVKVLLKKGIYLALVAGLLLGGLFFTGAGAYELSDAPEEYQAAALLFGFGTALFTAAAKVTQDGILAE
jgi:hypothetical protein